MKILMVPTHRRSKAYRPTALHASPFSPVHCIQCWVLGDRGVYVAYVV